MAIIDHTNKVCICLELKWFVEPAEIREIIERTEELAQGVRQAKRIAALFASGNEHLLKERLLIDSDYRFLTAVGSMNWIGHSDVQDPSIPIIKAWHLVEHIKNQKSLIASIEWLTNRQYLPVENREYRVTPWQLDSGGWTATWYGIEPFAA